ncbi:uncharacterized protein LOC101863748 [Aplysia californica]|uniref:Uncharacterized protein LOC101863748 n=1 Tax=Aplysia californica TaxID=6500 RepID=A0ABM0JRR6_APLCA|nr:uncharacterized protein LOC101863748 [Aplysia californica]
MGTKVIDKLRIQGSAAPRYAHDQRRPVAPSVDFHQDQCTFFLPNTSTRDTLAPASVVSHSSPSSAASRRLDYLQRVQKANRGLTSYDSSPALIGSTNNNNNNPNNNNTKNNSNNSINTNNNSNSNNKQNGSTASLPLAHTQFLLRGRTVAGDHYEIRPQDMSPHQRVGHYKTSAKEVYRARHRAVTDLGYSVDPRDVSGVFRPVRSAECDANSAVYSSVGKVPPASMPMYFLGPPPPNSVVKVPNGGASNGTVKLPPTPAPTTMSPSFEREDSYYLPPGTRTVPRGLASHGGNSSFSLTGHQLQTPRVLAPSELDSEYFMGGFPRSHTFGGINSDLSLSGSLLSRRRHQWPRGDSREMSFVTSDPTLLKECLTVSQSGPQLPANASPEEIVKLKTFAQYVKKEDANGRVNYNNPYRNLKTRERKALSEEGRYVFNSVDSYIHFNKIYPRVGGHSVTGSLPPNPHAVLSHIPQVPQVDGFSSHCTDTVLLKMMFEMNKTKGSRSVSKYSDVALHKDLEEFVIVGTPSLSRTPSLHSRRHGRSTRSRASWTTIQKDDEDVDKNGEEDRVTEVKSPQKQSTVSGEWAGAGAGTFDEEIVTGQVKLPNGVVDGHVIMETGPGEDGDILTPGSDGGGQLPSIEGDDSFLDQMKSTADRTDEHKDVHVIIEREECYSSASASTGGAGNDNQEETL